MSSNTVELSINGENVEEFVDPMETLQSVLRERLGKTATKVGCKQGGCGSCTVLVDGEPVVSCLLPVEAAVDKEITTLEGIYQGDDLHPLQEAFDEHFAMQCGYCTPGMIITAKALLDRNPDPSRTEIEEAISGNICRCTGYDPIVDAVQAAAETMNGGHATDGGGPAAEGANAGGGD